MAPNGVTAGGQQPAAAAKPESYKEKLYSKMTGVANLDRGHLFTQTELMGLNVVPAGELQTLMSVLQVLCNENLAFAVTVPKLGGVAWRWRERSEAEKYKLCNSEEQRMVYGVIDDAGHEGIWSQTLERKLKMNEKVMRVAIKQLIAKNLVRQFVNVEAPSKKMYIKASIQPSGRATGGPWYTDQTFDQAFTEDLQRFIYDYIRKQSTETSKSGNSSSGGSGGGTDGANNTQLLQPKKGVLKGAIEKPKKRTAEQISGDNTVQPAATNGTAVMKRDKPSIKTIRLLPYPAGYTEYPTIIDIARFIYSSGITHDTVLTAENVKELVSVLVWDGLIEPVQIPPEKDSTTGTTRDIHGRKKENRIGYRITRIAQQSHLTWSGRAASTSQLKRDPDDTTTRDEDTPGAPVFRTNGFTETPCGRCPVFELCEEGGPVSPSNCVYFDKWLNLDGP